MEPIVDSDETRRHTLDMLLATLAAALRTSRAYMYRDDTGHKALMPGAKALAQHRRAWRGLSQFELTVNLGTGGVRQVRCLMAWYKL